MIVLNGILLLVNNPITYLGLAGLTLSICGYKKKDEK